jgi:hypothetical protein
MWAHCWGYAPRPNLFEEDPTELYAWYNVGYDAHVNATQSAKIDAAARKKIDDEQKKSRKKMERQISRGLAWDPKE